MTRFAKPTLFVAPTEPVKLTEGGQEQQSEPDISRVFGQEKPN